MALTIDELQIEIRASSSNAASGIDALEQSLRRLRAAVAPLSKGGVGLTALGNSLKKFSDSVSRLSGLNLASKSINDIAVALQPLEKIQKSGFSSIASGLAKITQLAPQLGSVTNALRAADINGFAAQIQRVADAMRPLAEEAAKVYVGLKWLPSVVNRVVNANSKLKPSLNKTARSFTIFGISIRTVWLRLSAFYIGMRRIVRVFANWIDKSNQYVENLNLFTVAMGKYTEEAKAYAEQVQELVGIDASEFMRYQGVFMNMAKGFGIAEDKAAKMSKNLTQLGYDLASLYNVKFDTAMEKLESALSGQPRPMREWGFDLSEATLKAKALEMGIRKNVETMSQAEKAQLRYVKLLETAQKIGATGDLARTLGAPANQLRILKDNAVQAARALGNIFIPALNAILPYAIAFLKVVRNTANSIANLFGFSMPEIDYSGLENIGAIVDDDTEAVKELKNALLGIDELNIIGENNTGSLLGDDFDFDLPEYDFLKDLVATNANQIAEKFQKPFEEVLRLVGLIGAALLTWKIASGVIEFINYLKEIGKGGTITFGVTLSLVGFSVSASGFKAVGSGNAQVMDYVKAALGSALGIAGSLISFGTGPLGWAIGISASLVVGLVSISVGTKEKLAEEVKKAFYESGDGITISEIAIRFDNVMVSLTEGLQPIIDGQKEIDALRSSISSTNTEINNFVATWGQSVDDTGKYIEQLKDKFNKLEEDTADILLKIRDNIVNALSGAFGVGLVELGYDIEEVNRRINDAYEESKRSLESVMKTVEEANRKYQLQQITLEEYNQAIRSASAAALSLINPQLDLSDAFSKLRNEIGSIDWENETQTNKFFEDVVKSAENAKQAVSQYFEGIVSDLQVLKNNTQSPELKGFMQGLIEDALGIQEDYEAQIDAQLTKLFDYLQADLIAKTEDIVEAAKKAWEDKGGFGQFLHGIFGAGTSVEYVHEAMLSYRKNFIDPLSKQMQSALADLDIDAKTWAPDTFNRMIESFFSWGIDDLTGVVIRGYADSLANVIKDALNEALGDVSATLNLTITANGVANAIGQSKTIKGYAGGGYPSKGELFIANERGPEFVGTIGNRTAVLNDDQMAASLASANEPQNELLREQNAILRQLLEKGMGVYLDKAKISREIRGELNQMNAAAGPSLIR